MFHLIASLILFIITVITEIICPTTVAGGAKVDRWQPGDIVRWFDPKKFVTSADWYIGASLTPDKWEKIQCKNHADWARVLDKHNKDGLCIANNTVILRWQNYTKLPLTNDTHYLRIYKTTIDTLKGVGSFLMTPFLRTYQRDNILRFIPDRAKLFDIGIGTGRSKQLWQDRHCAVWGVEPHTPNYENLLRKRLPMLRDSRNWGGENPEIRNWIAPESMDIVMMSYSITFFFENSEKLTELLRNVDHALRPGGRFIIIGMDGAAVQKWLTHDIDNECFRLVPHYDKPSTFGSRVVITMKNPFTLVEAQTEYLVDFSEIARRLKKYKCLASENVKPPYYLSEWPAKFVAAQHLVVYEKPK